MQRRLTICLFCLLFLHGLISEVVFRTSWALNGEDDSRANQFIFELAVCATTASLLYARSIRLPAGTRWFALYVTWCLLSGLITSDTVFDGFMYCRYAIYAFALYTAVWNYTFENTELGRINRLITGLAVLQLIATGLKLFAFKERTEWRVGTMTTAGGGLATVFPMLVIAYAMGYYFYVRRSYWVLMTGFSFALIGYASGKRAIYFVLPLMVVINVLLYSCLERGRGLSSALPRVAVHLGISAVLSIPAILYGISHSDGIGIETEGATASEIVDHALDYARAYEYGRANNRMIAGRTGASEMVMDAVLDAPATTLLFGWGPAALMPKRGDALQGGAGFRPLGIAYGIVGWSHDAISIGLPGTAFYLMFVAALLRKLYGRARQARLSPMWRGLCFGTFAGVVALLYGYLFYDVPHTVVTFVLLFYSAVVLSPIYRSRLTSTYEAYSQLRFRIVPVGLPLQGRLPY